MLLIDADNLLVYRIGFAVEKDPNGEEAFKYNIRNFLDKLINKLGDFERKIYLTGVDNFRDEIATLLPYKGNRTGAQKPKYYRQIREYLIANYGAIVVDGMEADDALGIEQMKYYHEPEHEGDTGSCDSTIVACDKDMDMIPGKHYNPVKDKEYWISNDEGYYNFYKQCLTGDATDNIPGLKGYGPKTAEKWLEDHGSTMQSVIKAYKDAVVPQLNGVGRLALKNNIVSHITSDEDILKIVNEIGTLLWIRRE